MKEVVLLCLDTRGKNVHNNIDEIKSLLVTLSYKVVYQKNIKIRNINVGTFIGKGNLILLQDKLAEFDFDRIVISQNLSSIQFRNLVKIFNKPIMDRTGIILEIFEKHAKSNIAKLQVEMARLNYEKSRLVRIWTHLERQRGKTAKVSGPGERQIEIDRRLINKKISSIKIRLKKVRVNRKQQAKNRKNKYPIISLVGYTNAGKTALFNAIVKKKSESKDMLFATLDTKSGKFYHEGEYMILNDTVGFIANLPTELIQGFTATLEEIEDADLLIHVIDCHAKDFLMQQREVQNTLNKMNISPNIPIIKVYNKVDLIDKQTRLNIQGLVGYNNIFVSAKFNYGIGELKQTILLNLNITIASKDNFVY